MLGQRWGKNPVPPGTAAPAGRCLGRPCGTCGWHHRRPSTQVLGYSQSSLRDGQDRAASLQKTEMRPSPKFKDQAVWCRRDDSIEIPTESVCLRPAHSSRQHLDPGGSWTPWPLALLSNRPPDLLAKAATQDPERSRCLAAASAPLSLAPGFSRVSSGRGHANRFNGLSRGVRKTAEAVGVRSLANTRLKPGANERAALAPPKRGQSAQQPVIIPPSKVRRSACSGASLEL